MKLGPTKRAVCPGCNLDTYLHEHAGGWFCPDCRTTVDTDAPPPPKHGGRRYNRNSRPLPLNEAVQALEMYRNGGTVVSIADTLHRDRRRVSLTLQMYGVQWRTRGIGLREVCRNGLHRLEGDNVVWVSGQRRCVACRRENLRRSNQRRNQKQAA